MEAQKIYNAIMLTAPFLFVVLAAPLYIGFLKQRYFGQYIREEGPRHHQSKAGTPTAGGVVILAGLLVGVGTNYYLSKTLYLTEEALITLGIIFLLGGVGFIDDYLKIAKKNNRGVSGYVKLAIQALAGLGAGLYVMNAYGLSDVAVFNWFRVDLGLLFPVFSMLVVMGASNAVNLTDGLDGLATGTCIISLMAFSAIFSGSLYQDIGAVYPDLAMICLALMGSLMGFFFFNMKPAKIFMGDTGSLALGAGLGAMAVLGRVEFWLLLIGGVFVLEALSVILQVASFKTTGRRIFRMSPLHHHFELGGWSETKVVFVFVILQIVLCGVALFLYNR